MREKTFLGAGFGCAPALAMLFGTALSTAAQAAEYRVSRADQSSKEFHASATILSDTQVHNPYGEMVPLMETSPADFATRVAVRPPALDFLSLSLLEHVLKDSADRFPGTPILHLGDAADVSCTGEFRRFVDVMNASGRHWVFTPGNHDGFFFGNAHLREGAADLGSNLGLELAAWKKGCKNDGAPMDKGELVQAYVKNVRKLASRPGFTCAPVADGLADADSLVGSFACKEDGGFLAAIAWSVDHSAPWRSWVVQRVRFGPPNARITGILLDTAAYEKPPAFLPLPTSKAVAAGMEGALLEQQVARVDDWFKDGGGTAPVVLFGHHPYADLGKEAKQHVFGWIDGGPAELYVSAHSHAGQWIGHFGVEAGKKKEQQATDHVQWTELNIGSTVDWPIEYRGLGLSGTAIEAPLRRVTGKGLCDALDIEVDIEQYKVALLPGPPTFASYANRALLDLHLALLNVAPTSPTSGVDWPCSGCGSDTEVRQWLAGLRNDSTDDQVKGLLAMAKFHQERPVTSSGRSARDRYEACLALAVSREETKTGDIFSSAKDECEVHSDCGPTTQWYCDTGAAGVGNNKCRRKLEDGKACTAADRKSVV